jgi:hypothetical protein
MCGKGTTKSDSFADSSRAASTSLETSFETLFNAFFIAVQLRSRQRAQESLFFLNRTGRDLVRTKGRSPNTDRNSSGTSAGGGTDGVGGSEEASMTRDTSNQRAALFLSYQIDPPNP